MAWSGLFIISIIILILVFVLLVSKIGKKQPKEVEEPISKISYPKKKQLIKLNMSKEDREELKEMYRNLILLATINLAIKERTKKE